MLQHHLQVGCEGCISAFRDFLKTIKRSLALYFALRRQSKPVTYPELKFKSKFAPSNSIELCLRPIRFVRENGKDFIRFYLTYFGFGDLDSIEQREPPPELSSYI